MHMQFVSLSLYIYNIVHMYRLTYIYAVIQRITVCLNSTVGEHALGYTNGLPDFSHFHFDTRWAPVSLAFLKSGSSHWTKVTESAVVGGPMVLLPIFFWGAGWDLRHRLSQSRTSRRKVEGWGKKNSASPLVTADRDLKFLVTSRCWCQVFLCKTILFSTWHQHLDVTWCESAFFPVENHGKFLQNVDIILRARINGWPSQLPPPELSRRSKGVIRGGSWKSQSHNKPEPLIGDEDITSNNQRCAWPGTCLLDITLEWCWHTGLIPWTQTTETLNICHPHTAAPSETSVIHLEIGGKRFDNPADFQVLHVLRRGKRLN